MAAVDAGGFVPRMITGADVFKLIFFVVTDVIGTTVKNFNFSGLFRKEMISTPVEFLTVIFSFIVYLTHIIYFQFSKIQSAPPRRFSKAEK